MSESAHNLVDAFTSLPVSERHAVLLEFARISEGDAGEISFEEFTIAGAKVFSIYDAEEAADAKTNAG